MSICWYTHKVERKNCSAIDSDEEMNVNETPIASLYLVKYQYRRDGRHL